MYACVKMLTLKPQIIDDGQLRTTKGPYCDPLPHPSISPKYLK